MIFHHTRGGDEIELNDWPRRKDDPPILRLLVADEDDNDSSIILSTKEVARLIEVLDCWLEKGILPEKDEVWE